MVEVTEEQIDAVTGVSGSGPAYVFRFIEALIEGGVAEDLPPEVAATLALQTVIGAAKLVSWQLEKTQRYCEIESPVPGGTTLAALNSLQKQTDLGQAIVAAVSAATARSKELAAEVD